MNTKYLSAVLVICLPLLILGQQPEPSESYPLLHGEAGKGNGFAIDFLGRALAVTSKRQFGGQKPTQLLQTHGPPLILNPKTVGEEQLGDAYVHLITNPKDVERVVVYDPKFSLKENEPLFITGATGRFTNAVLHSKSKAYSSSEGPKILYAILAEPAKTDGAVGAPIIQASTGKVVGIFLAFEPVGREPIVVFQSLTLPTISKESMESAIEEMKHQPHKEIIGAWIQDWALAEEVYRKSQGQAFDEKGWETFKKEEMESTDGLDLMIGSKTIAFQRNGKTIAQYPIVSSEVKDGYIIVKRQDYIGPVISVVFELRPDGGLVQKWSEDFRRASMGRAWRRVP